MSTSETATGRTGPETFTGTETFTDARAIVTGAAGGIGAALAAELISRGASVVLADLSPRPSPDTAAALKDGAHAWVGDVSSVAGIDELIAVADDRLGGVDMYFANAGIIGPGELGESDGDWDIIIDVNLRAHIRAAQALIPRWQEAGEGYFVATASAAGLLTQIGSAAYSVTKHASVGFAEWVALTYRDDGIRASAICPMGVDTDLLRSAGTSGPAQSAVTEAGQVLAPADVRHRSLSTPSKPVHSSSSPTPRCSTCIA